MFVRSSHQKTLLAALAAIGLSSSAFASFSFVEDFSTDPVAGGRFSVTTGDSNRFTWSSGKLTAQYDTTLPTAKYLHHLGMTFTEGMPFSMIFDLTILSAGFFADPDEFAQIAVGAVNSVTTGVDRPGGVNGDAYDIVTADYYPNDNSFWDTLTMSPTAILTSNNPSYFSHIQFTWGAETVIKPEFPSGLPLDTPMRWTIDYDHLTRGIIVRVLTNGTPLAINTVGSSGAPFDSDPTTIQTFLAPSHAFAVDSFGLLLWKDTFAGFGSGTSVVATVEFTYLEFTSPVPEPSSVALFCVGGLGVAGFALRRKWKA